MSDKLYMTKESFDTLLNRLKYILKVERPEVTATVRWAAGNGDRSENADYIYGKRKLYALDKEIYRLQKKLDKAVIVDTSEYDNRNQIFFGAYVTYQKADGKHYRVHIVGDDESNPSLDKISYRSPLGQALLKKQKGECVYLSLPDDQEEIQIIDFYY